MLRFLMSKKFDIAFCTFLCFIAPCVAAPGDARTSTVTLPNTSTPVVITTLEAPGESEYDHLVRHKNVIDKLIAAHSGPVDVPTGPITGSGH